jgi:hypothetical protein
MKPRIHYRVYANQRKSIFAVSNMAALRGICLAPPPATVPDCHLCHQPSERKITRTSNRKGNAGRPFYKCFPCDNFLCFDDRRGNLPSNPLCYCQVSSKLQVSGPDKRVARALHYVCRLGACDYYEVYRDAHQRQITIDEDMVNIFARLQII